MSIFLLEIRNELNIPQYIMAYMLGISKANLNAIEQGKRVMPVSLKKALLVLDTIKAHPEYAPDGNPKALETAIAEQQIPFLLKERRKMQHRLALNQKKLTAQQLNFSNTLRNIMALEATLLCLDETQVPDLYLRTKNSAAKQRYKLTHTIPSAIYTYQCLVSALAAKLNTINELLESTA